MPNQSYAMLSYHPIDLQGALRLATDLQNMGWPVWMDRLDSTLSEDNWVELHEKRVNGCSLLIVLLSADYAASTNSMRILQTVYHRQVKVLPLLLRPVDPLDWPPILDATDYLDMTDPHQSYADLLKQLSQRLSAEGLFTTPLRPEFRLLNEYNMTIEEARSLWDYVRLSHRGQGPKGHTEPLVPPSVLAYDWLSQAAYVDHGSDGLQPQPIVDLSAFLQKHPRCLLTGPLGSGKTSTLQHLLRQAMTLYRQDSRTHPWPCFLSLGLWQPDESLEDFLGLAWPFRMPIHQEAQQGNVAFFLDGLDEMARDSQRQRQALAEWLAPLPCRIIITCDSAHLGLADGLGLRIVSLEIPPQAQSDHILRVSLGNLSDTAFWEVAQPANAWSNFLRRPLNSRLAAFVHRHSTQAPLLAQRGLLLRQALELRWEREQITRHPQWLPLEDVLPQLALLAFTMIEEGYATYVDESFARNFFQRPEGYAVACSAQILQNSLHGAVSFTHPAWLALLAAQHILHHDTPHAYVARLAFDEQGRRLPSPWDAPISLLASLVEDASVFLNDLAQVDPLLVALCLEAGAPCSAEARQAITRQMIATFAEYPTSCWPALYSGLQVASEGQALSLLIQAMRDDPQRLGLVALDVLLASAQWKAWHMPPDLQDSLANQDDLALAQARHDSWLPPLLAVVAQSQDHQAPDAVRLLAQLGDRAAIPALLKAWPGASTSLRSALTDAFGLLRAVQAVPLLFDYLQQISDLAERRRVALALAAMGSSALPFLLPKLRDPSPAVRRIAAGILAYMADKSAMFDLVDGLRDPSADVRAMCASALGRIGHPWSARFLARLLSDSSQPTWTPHSVGQIALRALEKIRSEEAVSFIKRWLERRPKPSSSQNALERLKDITGQRLPQLEFDPDETTPSEASPPQGTYIPQPIPPGLDDPPQSITELLTRLSQGDSHQRHQAAQNLTVYAKARQGRAGSELDILLKVLSQGDPFTRWAIVEALAWLREPRSLPHLLNALADPSWTVRVVVVQALGELNDPRAVPSLIAMLQQESHALVREACAEVLGRMKDASALEALTALLQTEREADTDRVLQWTLIQALGELADPRAIPHLEPYLLFPSDDERTVAAQLALERIQKTSSAP